MSENTILTRGELEFNSIYISFYLGVDTDTGPVEDKRLYV